jgi:hypothetical protein
VRQNHEETDITKRTNASKRAKKTGQRLKIKIAEVFCIGRNHDRRNDRRHRRNGKNNIFVNKSRNDSQKRIEAFSALMLNNVVIHSKTS